MNKEQFAQRWQELKAQGMGPDEIKARLKAEIARPPYDTSTMSGRLGETGRAMAEGLSFNTPVAKEFLENIASSLVSTPVEGVRQMFNYATGDVEEEKRLAAERDARLRILEQTSKGAPVASTVGEVAGMAGPLVTGAGVVANVPRLAARTAPATAGVLGRVGRGVGAGAGAGAVGGFTQPVSEAQFSGDSSTGARLSAGGVGGTLGGVLGGAVPGVSHLFTMAKRELPEEMVGNIVEELRGGRGDFTANLNEAEAALRRAYPETPFPEVMRSQVGQTGSAVENIQALRGKVSSKVGELQAKFNDLYTKAETGPAGKIRPAIIQKAFEGQGDNLPGMLAEVDAPKTAKLLGRLKDTTEPLTFREVREAQRELKAVARKIPEDNRVAIQRVTSMVSSLDTALDEWAAGGANRAKMLSEAKGVDDLYGKEMAPWQRKDTDVGKMYRYGSFPTGKEAPFLSRAESAQDLLTRVPEARDPLRNLYLSQLGGARTPQAAGSVLGRTASEVLLSPEELARFRSVVESPVPTPPGLPGGIKQNWPEAYLDPYGGPNVQKLAEAAPEAIPPLRAIAGEKMLAATPAQLVKYLRGSGVRELAGPELAPRLEKAASVTQGTEELGPLANMFRDSTGPLARITRGVAGPNEAYNRIMADLLRGYLSGSAAGNYMNE